jgi:hypothetical protein
MFLGHFGGYLQRKKRVKNETMKIVFSKKLHLSSINFFPNFKERIPKFRL